jgi:hypothetical protein
MSGTKRINTAAVVLATAFLWERAILVRGGMLPVVTHVVAGVLSAIGLIWIFREFASLSNNRSTLAASAAAGLCVATPVIATLTLDSIDMSGSSNVVLAFSSAAVAAMGGAIWGMAALAHDAFSEWRRERNTETRQLTFGGAHQ